jgi:ATP-grasp domain
MPMPSRTVPVFPVLAFLVASMACSARSNIARASSRKMLPAEIVHTLGSLVRSHPAIQEIDINPVVVYPEGMGAVALDALIVSH